MPTVPITSPGLAWTVCDGRGPAHRRTFAVDHRAGEVFLSAALVGPESRVVDQARRDDRRVVRDRGRFYVDVRWLVRQPGAGPLLNAIAEVASKELGRCQ